MKDTLGQLSVIFDDVFDEPGVQINRSTSAEDIQNWDSITHVTMVLAVEREFQIRFSSSEVAKLQNVGELIDLIDRKIKR